MDIFTHQSINSNEPVRMTNHLVETILFSLFKHKSHSKYVHSKIRYRYLMVAICTKFKVDNHQLGGINKERKVLLQFRKSIICMMYSIIDEDMKNYSLQKRHRLIILNFFKN